ncbi:PREDICTED: receptor-like protein kinase FERONIA [Ipomoea nil]|uniref:receptor-like protein kinase FERONIA n=1 Tax=Ipomoea nil TaxID=35883 RepID=UPI000900955F|nr:PREDICTED: receptor-like protein kinase FERONIA [Ipomoea nil]
MFSVLPFLLFLFYVSAAVVAESPAYSPPEHFFLNCGASSSNLPDRDGRIWDTDNFTKFIPANAADISVTPKPEEQGPNVPQIPYTTGVRIFQSNFTYSFPVSAGPKFLRLYFFPSLPGFNKTESYFSVTANDHTLLGNFSPYLTAAAGRDSVVQKEYIVNVDDQQMLNVTFAPSPNSFAFVNGIEIVSIPTGYYIRGESAGTDDDQIKWVPGNNIYYYIYNNTALETLYRLTVGGQSLSPKDDTGMYRTWSSDDEYVVGRGYFTPNLDVKIKYTAKTPEYSAPEKVYTHSRTIANYSKVVNWTFPVDSGFLYLFRSYFCEFAIEIDGGNQRVFSLDIANTTAENHVDVFLMAEGSKIPIFRDYLVNVKDTDGRRGKTNVSLAIRPNMETRPVWANALLNGLEIFKLNDTQGSLAASNPDLIISQPVQSPPPGKKKGGATIGAVVGGVGGGVLVMAILGFFIFRQRRRRVGNSGGSVTKTTWDPLSAVPPSTHNTDGSGTPLPSDLCRSFSLEDLKAATSNFDENFVVGKGGFGKVYRGFIDNGAIAVAIKRLNPESSQGIREFQTEIEMLSRLRHLHLVSLIGYCNDNGEMILVYDYMARGTLRDHLYKSDNPSLPWKKRLEISIGAAKGLHYLHTGAKWTIIHRDVKSTNILLDERWVAKVSDFGLSKVGPLGEAYTHVSTAVKGSVGYVDPEYYRRQQVTEKSDVYSFGVVLFEVLCARPAVIPTQTRERVNLAEWARQCCRKGTVDQMVDPRLRGEIAPESLNKYAEIACNCLKEQGVDRPAMSDVVWSLEFALQLQEAAEKRTQAAAGDDGFPPGSPSFPLLGNGDSNTTTDSSEGGVFSTSDEVAAMSSTTSGSGTATTTTGVDRLQSHNVFSLLNHPEGR